MGVTEHQPPEVASFRLADSVVFLAGPIQGAPDWQKLAIEHFKTLTDPSINLQICNPRRAVLGEDFIYEEQVAWEKAYLKRAAKLGSSILFWFEAQDFLLPYPAGRPYAKTSKKELDRAFGWKDSNPDVNISIGIHPKYEGMERYTHTCINEFDLPIHVSLESTCLNALQAIQAQKN